MINYSIIIPHKNIPHLLQRCLDSIPRRDDVQILVVDDNSDANIVDFEHFPGLNDPFVEVIFARNEDGRKGAGYARNLGLEKAKGRWLVFADADDYFTDNFLQYLDIYKETDYDLIYFGINGIDAETGIETSRKIKYEDLMYKAISNNNYDLIKYNAKAPWGKIIKRSLIIDNNILFDETMVANDIMFSMKTAYHSQKTQLDINKIYTSIYRDGSLVTIKEPEILFIRISVHKRVNDFLKSIGKDAFCNNNRLRLFILMKGSGIKYIFTYLKLIENKNKVINFIVILIQYYYWIIHDILKRLYTFIIK